MKLAAGDMPLVRWLGLAAAAATGFAVWLQQADPDLMARLTGACELRRLLNIPCPTCGTTRVVAAIGRGELMAALSANPLATLVILGIVVWGLIAVIVTVAPRGRRRLVLARGEGRLLAVSGAILVLANWLWLVLS